MYETATTSPAFTPVSDDLYREIILDHYRHPHHRGKLDPADGEIVANNPLCGDEVTLTWTRSGDRLDALAFEGHGCAISLASVSMLCDEISGKTLPEFASLTKRFRAMLLEKGPTADLNDLEALSGVAAYPPRIKCALLAWNALAESLALPLHSPGVDQ